MLFYRSMKEMHTIYNFDLANCPHLINYRNDFVLGCLTGLRFSDFSELMKDDIRRDMLYKKQNKSDHLVVIPLRDEALNILKYRIDNNVGVPTNAEFNPHIKTIAKFAGITDLRVHSNFRILGSSGVTTKETSTYSTTILIATPAILIS